MPTLTDTVFGCPRRQEAGLSGGCLTAAGAVLSRYGHDRKMSVWIGDLGISG